LICGALNLVSRYRPCDPASWTASDNPVIGNAGTCSFAPFPLTADLLRWSAKRKVELLLQPIRSAPQRRLFLAVFSIRAIVSAAIRGGETAQYCALDR